MDDVKEYFGHKIFHTENEEAICFCKDFCKNIDHAGKCFLCLIEMLLLLISDISLTIYYFNFERKDNQ